MRSPAWKTVAAVALATLLIGCLSTAASARVPTREDERSQPIACSTSHIASVLTGRPATNQSSHKYDNGPATLIVLASLGLIIAKAAGWTWTRRNHRNHGPPVV